MATGRRLKVSKKPSIRSREGPCYRFGLYRTKFATKSSGRGSHDTRCGFINGDRCYREVDDQESRLNSGPNKKRKFSTDRVESQNSVSSEDDLQTSVESNSVSDDLGARTIEWRHQEIENEDGEYVQEPNVYKSEWDFSDSSETGSDARYLGPGSGEFKQECSSGDDLDYVEDKGYSSFDSGDDHEARLTNGVGVIPSCRNVHEFERLGKISEGTYGAVHKARDLKTGDIVALKKLKMGGEREGFPVTALREISILWMLRHPSLVEMKEVVMDDFDGVYMVMECVDHELKGYMDRVQQPFGLSEVKRLMIQLLEGVSYLHDNCVMHRDLKTSNLLMTSDGELKICDFGMSRQFATSLKPYTSLVVTLWYRAPELLLGMQNYSTAVDMWSVGCIMAELLSKKPLFDGGRELEQIDKIFRTLGTPNDLIWPGYSKLPGVRSNFVEQPYNCLWKKFPGSPALTELGFDLLNKFLTYDPEKRISAKEALNHGWFCEAPLPAEYVRVYN